MHYSLLLYQSPEDFAARKDSKKSAEFWGSFGPYMTALKEAGIFVAGAGLQPPETATMVRRNDGKHLIQDGPFANTKEQLGGFIVIEVPNIDTALEWASRCPIPTIEVRLNVPEHE
jgi:hypothetical protein